MATYAIPPQKGMADVLNEAADANERGMEGARRSALTMSQLQGEQQRQRFAEAEAGRAEKRFGFEEKRFGFESENQDYQRRVRQRQETYIDDVNKIGQEELFERVQVPNPRYRMGQPPQKNLQTGEVEPEFFTTVRPYDLSTPQGLQAVSRFQLRNFQARIKAGMVDQNELNQIVTFSDLMEKRGYRDLFRGALSGDGKSVAALAGKLNLDPSSTRIVADVDNDKNSKSYGIPNIFAETEVSDGKGSFVRKRTAIGHLVAMYAPEVYDAAVAKPLAAMKDQSQITYQGKAGDAAVTSANAAVTSANAAASNANTNAALLGARRNLLGAQTDYYRGRNDAAGIKTDTATSAQRFASAFGNLDGKVPAVTGAFAQHGSIQEWARTKGGLQGAAAQIFANDQFSLIRQQVNSILPSALQRQEDALKRALTREEKRNIEAAAHAEIFDEWKKRADGGDLAGVLVNYGRRFNQQSNTQAMPTSDE